MKKLSDLLGRSIILEADEPAAPEETPATPKAPADGGTKNDMERLKSGSVSIDDIIEKLNSIRAGKSFKDAQVRSSLDEYFMSLKMPEKVALFAFLKGISQVLTGEIPPTKALEPEDPASAITMQKAAYKRKVKPTVIRASASPAKSPEENTSSPKPAPIKPKSV